MSTYTDLGYDRILVTLDGHEGQERILDRAITMAANDSAELYVGHVIKLEDDAASAEAAFRAAVASRIAKAEAEPGIVKVELIVVQGRIRESIKSKMIPVARPELIVCGSRKLAAQYYAELGSVSTYIVRNSPCDVLVVR